MLYFEINVKVTVYLSDTTISNSKRVGDELPSTKPLL